MKKRKIQKDDEHPQATRKKLWRSKAKGYKGDTDLTLKTSKPLLVVQGRVKEVLKRISR
jgi:hypothetical protein